MFTSKVRKEIGHYVYRLIDPRNGETFYVGRGKGNRVFQHAQKNLKKKDLEKHQDEKSEKYERIQQILNNGFEVAHIIHRHGMDAKTAAEVEAALIDTYAGLTNIQGGEESDDRGVMHYKEVQQKHEAEQLVPQHKLVIISINRSFSESERSVYDAVRYAWRISRSRANKCDYVLAVAKGIIRGAFVVDEWLPATTENFPSREKVEGRYGFHGKEAPKEIKELYVGKRLPDGFTKKGAMYPVRYLDETHAS